MAAAAGHMATVIVFQQNGSAHIAQRPTLVGSLYLSTDAPRLKGKAIRSRWLFQTPRE
jgi:hypothetical protein